MTILAPGLRYVDLRFQGAPQVIATAVLDSPGGVALDRSRAGELPAAADQQSRSGRRVDARDPGDPADAHPPRSCRRDRHAGARASAHPRVRPRARRAAHDRSVEADGQRRAHLRRRQDGHAVGADGARAGGEHHDARGRREDRRGGPAARRRLHAGPRLASRQLLRSAEPLRVRRRRRRHPHGLGAVRHAADTAAGHRHRGLGGEHRSRDDLASLDAVPHALRAGRSIPCRT